MSYSDDKRRHSGYQFAQGLNVKTVNHWQMPANRLELLEPKQNNIYSIRVNRQYRLIFKFENNELSDLYLDPHNYDL